MNALSDTVRSAVRTQFAPADVDRVEAGLEAASLPFLDDISRQSDRDRVHLAVLKLCNGDIASFDTHLANATVDWRDVLVAADQNEEAQ